jgi:methyltransferase (TIGR00027 family)
MSGGEPIRNISDTARWTAMHRAIETDRPDALFRDPLARHLAGERGATIVREMPPLGDWAWPIRTYLIDRALLSAVERGADMVINLAAGFDARPYRLPLPGTLRWVEVDLPALLQEKEALLRDQTTRCRLERIAVDLAEVDGRRTVFERLGREARKAVILSEGLLIYLERDPVGQLARDLAAVPTFWRWIFDLSSPGLVRMVQRRWGARLARAGSPLKFGPPEGPGFFAEAGWQPVEVHSLLKMAAALRPRRLPLLLRLISWLPDSSGRQGSKPWTGICVMSHAR